MSRQNAEGRPDRLPEVQFVSKPIAPPFHDGSKCLVRDLCLHLSTVKPHVLGTSQPALALGDRAVTHAVYGAAGGFSPALRQNLQVALFLLTRSSADLWHFVFAPNPRSSQIGSILKRVRRIPTVQTIASPPRSFEQPGRLLFGDVAVAQSAWTRAQFLSAYGSEGLEPPRMEVIPPPVPLVLRPSEAERNEARRSRGVSSDAPFFVYPGDLEVSRGGERVVRWSQELRRRLPGARVLVAYRDKSPNARVRALDLEKLCDPEVVLFGCNVADIHAVIATATAVLFPVEDLYGKVDLPIVLLEALRMQTPVLALNVGPLASLVGAHLLSDEDSAWLESAVLVATSPVFREELIGAGLRATESHYAPERVAAQYEQLYAELLRK